MSVHEILTFEMLSSGEEHHLGYCKALLDGEEVKVDPYVGCVWGSSHFEEGEATFEGYWWTSMDKKTLFFFQQDNYLTKTCAQFAKMN